MEHGCASSLEIPSAPFRFEPWKGVCFSITYATEVQHNVAERAAARLIDQMPSAGMKIPEEGADLSELDGKDKELIEALRRALTAKMLAVMVIREWNIRGETGTDVLPLTPENIRGIELYGEILIPLYLKSTEKLLEVRRARKRMRGRFEWIGKGGHDYCGTCKADDTDCSRGLPGIDGARCPFIETAPKTIEEEQAILALEQAGFDFSDVLSVLEALGVKNQYVTPLVSEACQGLRAGMRQLKAEGRDE